MKYIKSFRLIKESSELENAFLSLIEEFPSVKYEHNILTIKTPSSSKMVNIDGVIKYNESIEEYNLLLKELIICLTRTDAKFITHYTSDNLRLEFRFIKDNNIMFESEGKLLIDRNALHTNILNDAEETGFVTDDLMIYIEGNQLNISITADNDESEFKEFIKNYILKMLDGISNQSDLSFDTHSIEDVDDYSNFYVTVTLTFNREIKEI